MILPELARPDDVILIDGPEGFSSSEAEPAERRRAQARKECKQPFANGQSAASHVRDLRKSNQVARSHLMNGGATR